MKKVVLSFANRRSKNYNRNFLLIALQIVIVLAGFSGWGGCDGCSSRKKIKAPSTIVNVEMIVETSESMGGYVSGNTEFKEIIAGMASRLDKISKDQDATSKSYNFKLSKSSFNLYGKLNTEESTLFVKSLLEPNVMNVDSSPLHEILNKVIMSTDSIRTQFPISSSSGCNPPKLTADTSKITLLFTDMIMSFSPAEIRANPEKNVVDISLLQHYIATAFNTAKEKKLAVAVFQFDSKFNGAYFDYRNNMLSVSGTRPFYCIMIGDKATLPRFINSLKANQFRYTNMVGLGFDTSNVQRIILSNTLKRGTWYRDHEGRNLRDVKLDKDSITFCLGLDLSGLSDEYQKKSFLLENLKKDAVGLKVGQVNLYTKEEFEERIDKRDLKANADLNLITHYFEIPLSEKYGKEASMQLTINNSLPAWITNCHTLNDKAMNSITMGQTFGLENFVNGIAEAYGLGGKLLNIKIDVK